MSNFFLDDDDPPPPPAKQWTLQDIYNDLGTLDDVARDLNVTIWRVNKWMERRERIRCPQPVRSFPRMNLYSLQEWRGWFDRWLKRVGRNNPNNKFVKAKPYSQPQSFFTYELPADDD